MEGGERLSFPFNDLRVYMSLSLCIIFHLQAIIDTGSTGLIFPRKTFDAFKRLLERDYCHIPGICIDDIGRKATQEGPGGADQQRMNNQTWSAPIAPRTIFDENSLIAFEKSELDQLPILTIILSGGLRLNVGPDQYMARQREVDDDGLPYYALAITTIKGFEKLFVLGESLLNQYYVEFDRTKHRLGFAHSVMNCSQALTAIQ
jgi:Eukaryotic aspartyl protease